MNNEYINEITQDEKDLAEEYKIEISPMFE
jgi:hypothetical protein